MAETEKPVETTLEHRVALDCHKISQFAAPPPVGADIAWYWSEWFGHAAFVLALLYEMRAEKSGDSVRTWLERVVASDGPVNMVALIEKMLREKPPA